MDEITKSIVTVKSCWLLLLQGFLTFWLLRLLPEFFPEEDFADWQLLFDPGSLLFVTDGLEDPTGWLIVDRCIDPSDCLPRAYLPTNHNS